MRPLQQSDLLLGQSLRWSIYDRYGMLLLRQGGTIESESQAQTLLDRGCLIADQEANETQAAEEFLGPIVPFAAITQLQSDIGLLHRQILSGTATNADETTARMAETITDAIHRDADAALSSMQLQLDPSDHAARQTHAAVICIFAARALRLDDATVHDLACAALTYDIALGPISAQLNAQSTELTLEQRQLIRMHPERGRRLLEDAGITNPVWLDAVLHHHERLDGSGYPDGLRGDAILRPTRLLAIVDIYTAMLRPRSYRDALPARTALRNIFLERGKQVDEAFAAALIKAIGIYPPGTLVRLENGEIGIVLHQGTDAATPLVARLMTPEGYLTSMVETRDTRAPGFQITDSVPQDRYPGLTSFNIASLWM